jgi:hypothetical protein
MTIDNSILSRAIVSAINRTAGHFLGMPSLRENEGSLRSKFRSKSAEIFFPTSLICNKAPVIKVAAIEISTIKDHEQLCRTLSRRLSAMMTGGKGKEIEGEVTSVVHSCVRASRMKRRQMRRCATIGGKIDGTNKYTRTLHEKRNT